MSQLAAALTPVHQRYLLEARQMQALSFAVAQRWSRVVLALFAVVEHADRSERRWAHASRPRC